MHESPRRVLQLNDGWRFHLGEIETPLANTHIAAYMNNKAGYARGAAKTNYDDSDWLTVQLPHDWSVDGAFSPDHHMDAGYLPRGVGWYRRYVRIEESDRGKHVELNFDGVATHCAVYVNGHLVHRNFCGYTPFTIDLTDLVTYGDALNTIAVKVDATYMEGWWYEGAGIYREVELVICERDHIENVFITADASGQIQVETKLIVRSMSAPLMRGEAVPPPRAGRSCHELRIEIFDPQGGKVAESTTFLDLHSDPIDQCLSVLHPQAWTPDEPTLYTLRSELKIDDRVVDVVATRFGFRTIRFDTAGFHLNDRHTFLKGVCLHQDHAGVGVAMPESIERFRLLQMKSIGVNAIRCAHNPPSRVFLDLCDELGLLVMDENRNFGSSPEHLRQLDAMVKRDRNHPCVILWSICNEEAIQSSPVAANIARTMIDHIRELDSTRLITGAVSGGLLDDAGLSNKVFDVVSINYNLPLHDAYHEKHPEAPIVIAETGCTYATRGVNVTNAEKHHFAEDDTQFAPWGASARATWDHIRARPYLAGMFVWTGIDYRGEPTPHEWPSVQSHWGLFDLCCFPKRAARLHQELFESASIHSPPLAGGVGGGGVSQHGAPSSSVSHDAPPPNLPRVGGGVVIREFVHPEELRIELPDVMRDVPILADGQFTLPVTIASPTEEPIHIEIAGPAHLIGVGNGDPTSHVNRSNVITPFNGLAQLLVQTTREPGRIVVRMSTAEGESVSRSFVSVEPAHPRQRVPIVSPRHFINTWRMSPVTSERPDPMLQVSDQDMNTWERIDPRRGPQSVWSRARGYAIYRAKLTLPKSMQETGCTIRFQRVIGEIELFIDGVLMPVREIGGEVIEADCPSGTGARSISIILKNHAIAGGIAGEVELLPLAT